MLKAIKEKYIFICLFVGTALLFDYGVKNDIFTNIRSSLASTFLSVGIIGLVVDFMMRENLRNEMIRLVGIQGSIVGNKIDGAGSQEELEWDDLFQTGTHFKFILSDAEGWLRENWAKIERRAEEVQVKLEIYLPDPNAQYIAALSSRNGHAEDRLPRACNELQETLETLWKGMAAKARTTTNSTISIFHLETIPSYSLASSEVKTHLLLHPPVAKNLARLPFRLSFKASLQTEPVTSFHHKVNPGDGSKLVYENVVKK